MRMLARYLLGSFLLLALLVGGGWLALRQAPVQGWIAGRVPAWSGGALALEGPGGAWPEDIRLARVTLRDAQGVWLTVEGAALRWHPWALLHRSIEIERLTAEKVTLARVPVASAAAPKEESGGFDLSRLPPLRLDTLDLAEIDIAPAVTGGAAQRVRLTGHVAPDAARRLQAEVRLDTLEGAPTETPPRFAQTETPLRFAQTKAHLRFAQTEDGFDGGITAEEAAGGLLGRLLKIDPAQKLVLQGEGAMARAADRALHLQARLEAFEGARSWLRAEIAGQADDAKQTLPTRYRLRLGGSLPTGFARDPAFAALAETLHRDTEDIALEAALDLTPASLRLTIDSLAAGPLSGRASVGYPLAEGGALTVEATLDSALSPLAPLVGMPAEGQAHLQVSVAGTLAAPEAKLESEIKGLTLNAQAYPPITLMAEMRPQAAGLVRLQPFRLQAGDVDVGGTAEYDPRDATWNAHLQLPGTPLPAFAALLPPDALPRALGGLLHLTAEGHGKGAEMQAALEGGWTGIAGLPEPAAGVAGREILFAAALSRENEALRWQDMSVKSAGGMKLESSGTWEAGHIAAQNDVTLADARRLGDGIPGGSPSLHLAAQGTMQALRLDGRLAWAPPGLPALTGDARALLTDAAIDLQRLDVTAAGAHLTAQGTLPRGPRPAKGSPSDAASANAQLQVPDLAAISRYLGRPLSGKAECEAHLRQGALAAKATFTELRAAGIALAQGELTARADDLARLGGLQAELRLRGAEGEGWQLAQAMVHAQADTSAPAGHASRAGAPPRIEWRSDGRGLWQEKKLGWAAQGRWQSMPAENHLPAGQEWRIDAVKGEALGEPFALDAATTLQQRGDELRLAATTARFGALVAHAQWTQDARAVTGRLALDPVALRHIPLAPSGLPEGSLQARAEVTGTPSQPKLALTASGTLSGNAAGMPPLAVNTRLDWQGGPGATPLQAELHAQSGSESSASARVQTQGGWQLSPLRFALPPTAPLEGGAALKVPLAALNPWLRGLGHRLDGRMDGAFTLGGTLGQPWPQGALTVTDARYDHLASGVCLSGLNGRVTASAEALRFEQFGGRDAEGGTLGLAGEIGLQGARAATLRLHAQDYRLFCGGLMAGKIAGDIATQGAWNGALKATGQLKLGPVNVTLPETAGAAGIPSVKILEEERAKNAALEKQARKKTEKGEGAPDGSVALDIGISVPGRMFVRGRGLDAEFEGDLRLRGFATAPDVVGELRTRRGKFDLLDRQLKLTQGTLRFAGSIPPSPELTILAETVAEDATLRVTLEGFAADPKLTLGSTPVLPQDEILARLLFGRQLTEISPYQAIQLAQAARTLAGQGGGGEGVLGKLRGALGLDTLSVDQGSGTAATGDKGDTTVGTGKYLADGVYVGVEQGRLPESRRIRTELEVIPNVTVQTITGSRGETGGAVEWKKDY